MVKNKGSYSNTTTERLNLSVTSTTGGEANVKSSSHLTTTFDDTESHTNNQNQQHPEITISNPGK